MSEMEVTELLRLAFIVCTLVFSFMGLRGWIEEGEISSLIIGILFTPVISLFIKFIVFVSRVLI